MRAIITHEQMDFDALASMVGARRLYGGGQLVRGHHISDPLKPYINLHRDKLDLIHISDFEPQDIEEVIVVDIRNRRRLKPFMQLIEEAESVRVFDHHPATQNDIRADEAHIEPVGACATLLTEKLRNREAPLEPFEATLLALGLYADTGRLSYDSTTPRDLDAASWLLRSRARLKVINRYLEERFTKQQRIILSELLKEYETVSAKGIEIALGSVSMIEYQRDLSSVVEHCTELTGSDTFIGVFHFENRGAVQLIGRSRTQSIDLNELFSPFEGGGHAAAAAASIKEAKLDEVIEQLYRRIDNLAVSPETVSELMSSPVFSVPRQMPLSEIENELKARNISGVPVRSDSGELEGVISLRDIKKARQSNSLDVPASGFMSHRVISTTPDTPIERALRKMVQNDIGRLPVVEEGKLVGIISRTDMLERIYGTSDPNT